MSLDLRPSVLADFIDIAGAAPAYRCKCVTAVKDGRVIAIGGLVYRPDGVFASVVLDPEIRAFPVTLHRAVMRGLKEADATGIREIFAFAQADNPAAARWLDRLGFEQVKAPAGSAWVRQNRKRQ